ncbi:MAG TPA: hypothetical protein ENI85_14580 [Deltaproteobacteria bacterium]|nr:hypothetical protein [Deltaproteobacteria bacterium]
MIRYRIDLTGSRLRRFVQAGALATLLLLSPGPAPATEATWNDYLDHAYVYAAADVEDLRSLLRRATGVIGRSLAEYHAEVFPVLSARNQPMSEASIRRKAIAELLLFRTGELPGGLSAAVDTIDSLEDRLDRHENRYWFHVIHANAALQSGDAEAFVDQILGLWLEVITPLEVPFETYKTLALTENGNAGFVRSLPHLYESVARMILVQSQTAALDGDIDSLGAIARILTDERVGANPEVIPVEATSKAFLDHIVARLDGPESDGGSLSFTLALVAAERAHQIARRRLAEDGFAPATEAAIRDSVAAYQRALRNANTLQGQVAVYSRALRQLGEVHATGERLGVEVDVDVPFSIDRALALYDTLQAARNGGWERLGYVDQGREAYLAATRNLWSEIQDASFNSARYYMSRRDPSGGIDDESIVNAINAYSRYLHAFERYQGDPVGETLPDSAYFGAYLAARGIGDGVLFFAGGDASVDQLEEAITQYRRALSFFPFDRELWATLAVALQRSGRESEFLAVAKPVADHIVHSRHLDRWIQNHAEWAEPLESFRRAFENDRSLIYLGFADETKLDELETEFARLKKERVEIEEAIAATRIERDELGEKRREVHRLAAELSGENDGPTPPSVTSGPRSIESRTIAQLGLDLERLSSSGSRLEARIDAIEESLPIFEATLGHDDMVWKLAAQRDHPVHALLRRLAEETGETASPSSPSAAIGSDTPWQALQSWIGGTTR